MRTKSQTQVVILKREKCTYIYLHLVGVRRRSRCPIRIHKPLLPRRKCTRIKHSSWRRSVPEAVLHTTHWWHRKPIHRLSFDSCHDRPALKLAHFLTQKTICTLCIFVTFECHIPRAVVCEFTRYQTRTIFT